MTDKKISTFAFAALGLGLALTAHAAHVHASSKAIYKLETDQQEFKIGRHAFTYCYQKTVLAGNTNAIKKINAAWEKDYQHNQHNFALLKEAAVALNDLDTACSSRFLLRSRTRSTSMMKPPATWTSSTTRLPPTAWSTSTPSSSRPRAGTRSSSAEFLKKNKLEKNFCRSLAQTSRANTAKAA